MPLMPPVSATYEAPGLRMFPDLAKYIYTVIYSVCRCTHAHTIQHDTHTYTRMCTHTCTYAHNTQDTGVHI